MSSSLRNFAVLGASVDGLTHCDPAVFCVEVLPVVRCLVLSKYERTVVETDIATGLSKGKQATMMLRLDSNAPRISVMAAYSENSVAWKVDSVFITARAIEIPQILIT